MWRNELALCGRLLAVASAALNENAHIVTASLGLKVVLVAINIPLVAFMVAATRVGAPVASSLVASTAPGAGGELTCLDAAGAAVPCCAWQPAGGAVAYIVFASLCTSWVTSLIFEVRLFMIAHVVSRWYYMPMGARLAGKPITEAVSTAVGPSLGSLCLGSAILTLADVVRQAAESARQRGQGLLACLVTSLLACVAEILRLLTRFATVRCAVTGQGFMDAARGVTDLLARNALSSYGVWRFPPMVLGMTSLALGIGYAGATLLVYHALGAAVVATAGAPGSAARADAGELLSLATIGVAAGAGCLVLVVLFFLCSILLNVVDTVYICWASDLDTRCIVRAEVHAVFAAVPSVRAPGALVQQPDGELGYAPGLEQLPPRQQQARA